MREHKWRENYLSNNIWEAQKCIHCGLLRDRFKDKSEHSWIYFVPGESSDKVRIIHEYESPPGCLEMTMRAALR